MFRPPGFQQYQPSNGYSQQRYGQPTTGLTAYAANNSTAVPFELNLDDIARLDEDITTHAFREDYGLPSRQAGSGNYQPARYDYDKENGYRPAHQSTQHEQAGQYNHLHSVGKRMEDVGRLVADIAGPPTQSQQHPSSDPYPGLSPLQLRRSTSDAARNNIITPPISSPPLAKEQVRRPLGQISNENNQQQFQDRPFIDKLQPPYQQQQYYQQQPNPQKQPGLDGALYEMQQMYEERISSLRQNEQERCSALESEYKQKLARLQMDMNQIVEKQEHVVRLKGEVTGELQKDLDAAREALKREKEHRRADRVKYEARKKDFSADFLTAAEWPCALSIAIRDSADTSDANSGYIPAILTISSKGLNPHNASNSVSAIAISGL